VYCKKSALGYLLFLVTVTLILVTVTAMSTGQTLARGQSAPASVQQQPRPDLSTLAQRMDQAARQNRESYRAYVISREFRMYGGEQRKPSATVLAEVSFVPPKTKDYRITETQGSSRGETVVRNILEGEQKAAATGQAPGAVNSDNYEFQLQGEQLLDGHDCFVLGLNPKRKEKNLIIGRAWVDKNTYLVRRVQGQLAKMPSWWIKSAEVTLDFGDVSGMWLQTHMRAVADVRIVGPHTLQEDALKLRTGSAVAELIPSRGKAPRRNPQRTPAIMGTFER
jgi:Outer membrane lipoprotein-sorting protein